MSRSRNGEPDRTWFRSQRIYRKEDQWFIMTREGMDIGPYESADQARKDAQRLIEHLQDVQSSTEAVLVIKEFRERPRR